jgi:hypothetical protein
MRVEYLLTMNSTYEGAKWEIMGFLLYLLTMNSMYLLTMNSIYEGAKWARRVHMCLLHLIVGGLRCVCVCVCMCVHLCLLLVIMGWFEVCVCVCVYVCSHVLVAPDNGVV